jgi:hypothetical protein
MGYILTSFAPRHGLDFFNHLHHHFLACPHPLLIPASLTELVLEGRMMSIAEALGALKDIEWHTGFTALGNIAELPNKVIEPRPINYQGLVKKLGEVHAYYLICQTAIRASKFAIQSHLKHLKRLDICLPDEKLREYSEMLSDRLEYILNCAENALVYKNFTSRLQAQQAVVRSQTIQTCKTLTDIFFGYSTSLRKQTLKSTSA